MNAPAPRSRWIAAGEALLPDLVALRREIHREPELGLHTPLTTAKARRALEGLPLEFREGPSTTGFVAVLRGGREGRTVLLRGDMDALPMQEDTGLEFGSRIDGAMHACGHDTHVAMLVGAARALSARREELAGTVLFMFQPGEEGFHGARFMMDDGLLDPLPDAAFALHISPNVQTGVFSGRAGPLLASGDTFEVKVKGKGGHGAMPHETIDPVAIACEIVGAVNTMVARTIPAFDPVVVSVCRIASGTTFNVIPESAVLAGTIRSFSEDSGNKAREGLRRVAAGVAAAHGATVEVDIEPGFPVTICDGRMVDLASGQAKALFGDEAWMLMPTPAMGAEDFSYVLREVPGAMFILGATPEGGDWRTCCPIHSNRMVLDEAVMARGVALHCAVAETFLQDGFRV